jgi:hypothetical protein
MTDGRAREDRMGRRKRNMGYIKGGEDTTNGKTGKELGLYILRRKYTADGKVQEGNVQYAYICDSTRQKGKGRGTRAVERV